MSESPLAPVIVPDYQSQEIWDAFMSIFPEKDRLESPPYFQAANNLNKFCDEGEANGLAVHRVKVYPAGWMAWVKANNKIPDMGSVAPYACFLYAENELRNRL